MKKNLRFIIITVIAALLLAGNSNDLSASITQHPQNVSLCSGSTGNVTFSIAVSLGIYSYQWEIYDRGWVELVNTTKGVSISGATTTTLTFGFNSFNPISSSFNGTQVRCKVSSKAGTIYSNTATATVRTPVSIGTQPISATRVVGESVTFSVSASGTSPSYQWKTNKTGIWASISGAVSNSYTIASVASGDAASYQCTVTNSCGSVNSSIVTLTVWAQLAVTKHPAAVASCQGTTAASFTVTATGNSLTYQWQAQPYRGTWANIPAASGGTVKTYLLPALTTAMNNYSFRCIVTGNGGASVTSNSALLTVYSNPSVSGAATSLVKAVGESVTFSTSASGSLLQYIWRKNGVEIPGATSSSYTIPSLILTDGGTYSCKVSNTCNSAGVVGPNHVLTVETPAPDAWFLQDNPTDKDLKKLSVVSKEVAFAIAYDTDKILKTTNAGADWGLISTNYATYWYAIEFVDQSIGYVGGYNRIMKTENGGADWTAYDVKVGLPLADFPYVYDIQFISSDTGWAVGSGGLIMRTTNAGATWVNQHYKTNTDATLNAVHFVNSTTGFAAGQSGVILKTTDGGTVWTKLSTGVAYSFTDIDFTSALNGFAVSSSGVMKTNDGGSTWTPLTGHPFSYINSIDFVDANNGYMAGYYYLSGNYPGTVLKTNDGGTTWYRQKMESDGNFYAYSIEMASNSDGFLASQSGRTHRTAKGGCTTPKVSLYADQEVCAGSTVTLKADSFINNVNCKYLWTPGSQTSGTISVTGPTGTYGVTVTNECAASVSDEVLITFNALPEVSAGQDIAICAGETTQLIASGADTYSWNNSPYLDNPNVANPIATITSTRTFTVVGTDEKGCSASDAVVVTVNAIPSSSFTAPEFVCSSFSGEIIYPGGAAGSKVFDWNFDGGIVQSGNEMGPYVVSWEDLGDKNVSLTVTENGCASASTMKVVNIRQTPESTFETPLAVCGSNGTSLFYTGNAPSNASYNWDYDGGTLLNGSGQGPLLLAWATEGSKDVSLTVTDMGCSSTTSSKSIQVAYPFEDEQICLVTIDLETGKNMVVWEKTHDAGISSYNVYREGTVQNVYELLGNVPVEEISLFVDMDSNPEQQQYKYKISSVDTCGNESSKSPWHKTMFLQYVSSDDGVNLNWQEYQTESGTLSFNSYAIFRGSDSTALTSLATISSSFHAFTDGTSLALSQRMYYRVGGVKANPCDPAEIGGKKASSGPYVYSYSNLEDNRMRATGINNVFADELKLLVYPSPFSDLTNISYTLKKPSSMKVEVYNVVGEMIKVILDENQSAGAHKLVMNAADVNYVSGVYYIRMMVDDNVTIRKTMLAR